jgi:microcystin-dependent protein
MATINEFSIWEPNIYELETTDPVLGGPTGISNLSRQQLTNRTRKIFDVLEENGIFITESNHVYAGQNIDVTAVFEGSVADGNLVYWHEGNAQYEKAIADGTEKATFVGVADVTNGKVIAGGFLENPVVTGVPAQGDILFLSNTVAGQMTVSSSSVAVGKWLWSSVMSLNSGVGGAGAGAFDHEQDTYRMLLDDSWFLNGTWDNLFDVSLLIDPGHTMSHDFGDNLFTFTAGQFFETLDLYDPTLAITVDRAFVSVDIDDSGSTVILLTANGGANWEVAINNAVHNFTFTGTDLRLRVTGGGTGEVRSYGILYNANVNLWNNIATILHSAITNDEPEKHVSEDDKIGMIIPVLNSNIVPTNYLECNGALISQATYADLFSGFNLSIGGLYGISGGSFYLPDLRGRVPRGWNHGTGRDPDAATRFADQAGGITGDNVGSMQNDAGKLPAHNHLEGVKTTGPGFGVIDAYGNIFVGGPPTTGNYALAPANNAYQHYTSTVAASGNETRMKNFNVMWCIRYQ